MLSFQQEIAMFRSQHDITVNGHYIPKPLLTFAETNFPGWFISHNLYWVRAYVYCLTI